MKLHLSTELRRAVLACLAALALPTALPITIGTASGVVAISLLSYTRVQAQEAEEPTFSGPPDVQYTTKEWTQELGDIDGNTEVSLGESAAGQQLNFNPQTESSPNLKLTGSTESDDTSYTLGSIGDFASLWLTGKGSFHIIGSTTFSASIADIYVNGAQLCIDESANAVNWTETTIHIGASVATDGVFVAKKDVTAKCLDVVENAQISFGYIGMEDLFMGQLQNGIKANLTLDGIKGAGILTIGDTSYGTLKLTNGGTVGGITGMMAVGTTVEFGGTLNITGTEENCVYGGTLKALKDAELVLSGKWDVGSIAAEGNLGKLTLNKGASFGLEIGALSVGTLTLKGDASLKLIITDDNEQLTLGSIVNSDEAGKYHHLTIELEGLTEAQIGADGYNIFGFDSTSDDWEATWGKWLKWISVTGEVGDRTLKLNEKGMVVMVHKVKWGASDSVNSLTWQAGQSTGWDEGQTFNNNDDVLLTYTHQGQPSAPPQKLNVSVSGEVIAGDLTIQGDTSGLFVIAAANDSSTLTVSGNISVAAPTVFDMSVTVGGSISLQSGAELTLHEGSSIHGVDNKDVVLDSANFDDRGSVRIDLSDRAGQSFNANGMSFGPFLTLKLTGAGNGKSYFSNLHVDGKLEISGQEVVLQGENEIASMQATTEDAVHITFADDEGRTHVSSTFEHLALQKNSDASTNEPPEYEDVYLIIKNGVVNLEQGATLVKIEMQGGTLNIHGGTLTASEGITGTLIAPTFGKGDTGASLSLGTGDLTLSGKVSLNGTNSLTFKTLGPDGSGQKLVLQGAEYDEACTGSLQITITESLLGEAESGTIHLVDWGENNYGEWNTHITLNCDDTVDTEGVYAGIKIDERGYLTWGDASAPTGTVWNVNGDDDTWGTGHHNWGDSKADWTPGSNAVFSDANGEAITLSGAVSAGSVTVSQGKNWRFSAGSEGDTLTLSGKLTVSNGAALTVSADATALGLTLTESGTTVTFTGNHNVNMGVIDLAAGTKLILQGAQTWTGVANWNNYATGEGEVVFMGMGKQEVKTADNGGGILWAFTNNDEDANRRLQSLRLSTWTGGGEAGADIRTTLYITGEMGGNGKHGLANIANIWVDDGNSLVLGTAALGEPRKLHTDNTLHLAGDGSGDAYDGDKTADAALMLVGENSGGNRRTIKWNIDIAADTSVSVTDQGTDSAWTLAGKMYNSGKTVEKKGEQKLVLGADFTTSADASGGLGSGTWAVSAGTLELAYTTSTAMSGWTVELVGGTLSILKDATLNALTGGGALQINGGTLTLSSADGATLTNLAMGAGETTGNLNVNAGNFTISDGWTWVEGSKLTLGASGQMITLSNIAQLNNGDTDTKLTIDLATAFLGGEATGIGKVQLFNNLDPNWVDYFIFTVNGRETNDDYYKDLKLNGQGWLTWGKAGELHWSGNSGNSDDTLTLGTGEWSEEKGSAPNQPWDSEKDVFLEAESGRYTVKVEGDSVSMASLTLAKGAEYTLSDSTQDKTVTVEKRLHNDATLTVEEGIILKLNGGYEGNGTLKLAGGIVTVGSKDSLEGAKLELSGGELNAAGNSNVEVNAAVTVLENTTLNGVVLSGTVNGGKEAVLTAADGKITELTGNIAGYKGALNTGTNGTWKLSGGALTGTVGAAVMGSGTVQFEGTAMYGGKVEGNVTLEGLGAGGLTVISVESSEDAKLKGNVALGNGDTHAMWNGHEVTDGTITLANVTLAKGGITSKGGASVVVNTANSAHRVSLYAAESLTGAIVDVNGMNAKDLDGININLRGQLKGVTGEYTAGMGKELVLYFSDVNVNETAEDGQALIEGGQSGFGLNASNKEHVNINMDNSSLVSILSLLSEEGGNEAYAHLLREGTLTMGSITLNDLKGLDILEGLVKNLEIKVTGGDIVLSGSAADVYVVKGGETVDGSVLGGMKALVFGAGKNATFTTDGNATLHNLLGEVGSVMNLKKGENAMGDVTFILDNTYAGDIEDAETYPEVDQSTVRGQDTKFMGSIRGDAGVNMVKTGKGTLTVGGNYTLDGGNTRIDAGKLKLSGVENTMGSLTFAPRSDDACELLLESGHTTIEKITGTDAQTTAIKLSEGAKLTLTGESSMASTAIVSDDNTGELGLKNGASLTFTDGEGMRGMAVEMKKGAVLDTGKTESTLRSLNGTGTLKTSAGGMIKVGGGTFTGTLGSSGANAGTLVVSEGATFTLDKVTSSAGMGVRLENGSTLNVDVGDDALVFGNVDVGDGHMKLDYGEKGIDTRLVQGNITGWGEKGTVEFHSEGPIVDGPIGFKVDTNLLAGSKTEDELNETLGQHFKFSGLGNFLKEHRFGVNSKTNEVELTTSEAKENKFEREIPGADKNAHAGAEMLWESLRDITQADATFAVLRDSSSDYARLIYALVQCIDNKETNGLDRTLASVAGASISTLIPALTQDIHRQLTAIRNRTTTMAMENLADGYDDLPLWHAWLNAEGAYHKLDADGLAPGFTLHNWGGTVGVDVDISRTTTMGLAITAMYGDLEPDSADSASGDMDTYYLSAFARLAHGAWIHTLVVSGGIADVSLNRTVNYGGGSYRTDGSTDGCAFGAMYEVGYTGFVNKRGTVALQPIANVELRHVELSGYTETGSDAGVDADDMDMTVLTLGVGARVQAAVSANAFNRSTVLEGRLLVKTDIGDRSGTVENAIVKHASRAEVESAEVGAVGVEAGIGISIPIDAQSGSIFADASLEWRDNWVSTNATLGYRVNF